MRRKSLFNLPHLYDANGDISKPWWIELGYRDPKSNLMVRKRYQEEFTPLKTTEERYAHAKKRCKELERKLKRGWIPPDDNKVIYTDELKYHEAARVFGRKRHSNKNIQFFASQYIKEVKKSRSNKTHKSYRSHIRKLNLWLEKEGLIDNDLSEINEKVIKNFFDYLIEDLELEGKTISNYRISLGKFFRYLISEKVIVDFPIPKIEIPENKADHSAMPFKDEDLEKLLIVFQNEDPQLYIGALLQFYCFVRPGDELLDLKVSQINFDARTIKIPKNIAKKRRTRVVDIPNQMYDALIDHGVMNYGYAMHVISKYGRPGPNKIGDGTLAKRFNKIRDRLKIDKCYKWYSFKHTGAGKLLESGATIIELMNQLGHTDIESTYRYIKQHFGERSEHVRNKFPDAPGLKKVKPISNWMEGIIWN